MNIFVKFASIFSQRIPKVEEYKDTDWMRELLLCQDEIADCDPHPHYATYRKEEIVYWLQIARWLYEDARCSRVERTLDIGCAYGTLSLFCRKIFAGESYCTDFVDVFLSRSFIKSNDIHFLVNNIELEQLPWPLQFE